MIALRSIAVTACVTLALATATPAEQIGTVTAVEVKSQMKSDGGLAPAQKNAGVTDRSEMLTDSAGRMQLDLDEILVPTSRTIEEIDHETYVRVVRGEHGALSLVMEGGGLHAIITTAQGGEAIGAIRAGSTEIKPDGTELIVLHDKTTDAVEVIALSGQVPVRNVKFPTRRIVQPGQKVVVLPNEPPSPPEDLTAAQREAYLRPFELIGGGVAESQANGNALLLGTSVPTSDQAPEVEGPPAVVDRDQRHRPADDPCEHPCPVVEGSQLAIEF